MSVRKNDREHGKLECINNMRILISYTYDRVKDNNIFPKAQRWILAKSIWDAVSKAHSNMLAANAIRVENQTDAEKRLLLVKLTIGNLDDLISLVDMCHIKGMITDDRAEYWAGLATDTQNMTKAWLKSQNEMYRPFLKQGNL